MVLIDLQKAFDTIDHSILSEKMSCLGFAGKTIAWFTSYLTNRSFIVNVGKEYSSAGKLGSIFNCAGQDLGVGPHVTLINECPRDRGGDTLCTLSPYDQLLLSPTPI